MLQRLMHRWEENLSRRDLNRQKYPFAWGFEFLNHGFQPGTDPQESISRFNQSAKEKSQDFFRHSSPKDFDFDGKRILFPSSVQSPYPGNNTASARWFPSQDARGRAVVILPQWNADTASHVSLCSVLSRLGISALRLTLPYHEERNPSPPRADFMVSANIGRTIQAIQQSVTEARTAVDWLESQGYGSIGIMGTSVGSCIAFLAFVHDSRFRVGVFNHVSSFFGDVVWDGISTRHVKQGIEGTLTREQLHEAWSIISPNTHVPRLRTMTARKYLLISAKYDRTFPPHLSRLLMEEHDRWGLPYDTASIPCGHYSMAKTPFKHIDGFLISNYLRKNLPAIL